MGRSSVFLAAVAAVALSACGGGSSSSSGGSCSPGPSTTLTFSATGVTPKAVCLLPSGTLHLVNTDSVQHHVGSACTELNVGGIDAGTTKDVILTTAQTCSFNDPDAPTNAAFQGTVAVTSAPATGPGY